MAAPRVPLTPVLRYGNICRVKEDIHKNLQNHESSVHVVHQLRNFDTVVERDGVGALVDNMDALTNGLNLVNDKRKSFSDVDMEVDANATVEMSSPTQPPQTDKCLSIVRFCGTCRDDV
jgi:hypothetical protein